MKKNLLLAAIIILSLVGCGSSGGTTIVPVRPVVPAVKPTVDPTTNPVTPNKPQADEVPINKEDPNNRAAVNKSGIDGSGVTVGVIDSTFDFTKQFYYIDKDGKKQELVVDLAEFEDTSNPGSSRVEGLPQYPGNNNTHGTDVTEVIAGKTIGVAPKVKVVGAGSGDTCEDGSNGCVKTKVEMYNDLYDKNVRIFNQSFGSDTVITNPEAIYEVPLTDPIINFFKKRATTDSLFIWATGNEHENQPGIKAGLPYLEGYEDLERGWIAVTAVDSDTGVKADYANECGVAKDWCMAAVGDYTFQAMIGKVPAGEKPWYLTGAGTSYAAPAVTGAAALVQQKYPWMTADLIRQTLLSTAIDMGEKGVDEVYGWGRLDVAKAIKGPAEFSERLALTNDTNHKGYVKIELDSGTYSFDNNIIGELGVIIGGKGTLVLNGSNSYIGKTIVNGNLKTTSYMLSSSIIINKDGVLINNGGRFGKTVENNGGTFRVESDTRILDDYIITDANAITEIAVNSKIDISGKAKLANSKLKIIDTSSTYLSSSTPYVWDFLSAFRGIEGSFSTDIISPPLYKTELNPTTKKIEGKVSFKSTISESMTLEVSRKNVAEYADAEYNSDATRNNAASNVEQIFQALDNGAGDEQFRTYAAHLQQTSTSKLLATSLDSLSGQIYASAQALTFQQAKAIDKDLSNRLVWLGSMTNPGNSTGIWFNSIGTVGKLYEKGYAEADTSLYGAHVGVDKAFNGKFIAGTSFAYSDANADFNRYAGKSKSQNMNLSLYGRYGLEDDSLYVLGRIGAGYVKSDVERDVIIGSTTENLSVNHNDYVLSGYSEVGYKLKPTTNISITPFSSILYDSVNRGSFSEDRSLFGLSADKKTYSQVSGLLGLRAEANVNWIAGKSKLSTYASWQTPFNKEDLSFDASYVGLSNNKFNVKGIGLSDNTTWTGFGIMTEVNPTWSWTFNYDMQLERSKVMNNVVSVGARINLN